MKKKLNTTSIILCSFLVLIAIGTVLLSLPISSVNKQSVPFVDALFTATTSVCVTGLVTVTTCSTWSVFGQIVILFLIQIGGLGAIILLANIVLLSRKKLSIGNKLLLQDALNLDSMSDISILIKKIVLGTFLVEGVGALLYMAVFIPEYGAVGIWYSIFNSISAFCNAGIDIIKENSLCDYATNPIINFTTMSLIILGGLGFLVWFDLLDNIKSHKPKKIQHLSLHTKLVLIMTGVLIFGGALLFFILEFNNPATIGNMSIWGKIQTSLFQSVTCRTAGFVTIPQENLTNSSSLVSMLLMFVGGSPIGTAGGIKTVTILVLILSAFTIIQNKNEITILNRRIESAYVRKALAVCFFSFFITAISTFFLTVVSDKPFLDLLYEAISATATVGISKNVTATLNTMGKIVIIITMYLGRVGPITMATLFYSQKEKVNTITNPAGKIVVG